MMYFTKCLMCMALLGRLLHAEHPTVEQRGKILSTSGTPITLSPAGGYFRSLGNGESVGVKGLQKYYDDDLANGQDVQTSIHGLLQSYTDMMLIRAKVRLEAKEVLAMVMNSKTGEVLTIASSNRYDPLYIKKKDIPRLNPKFAQYPYEPGHVMMPFTVAMSLNAHMGERNKEKKWINTDYDKFPIGNGRTISDDHKQVAQTMGDVIVNSSSIGIAQIGIELTGNIVHYALTKYGFGQKSGIDLPRDLAGVIKSEELLENKTHRANTAYGYGMMATPIQLLKAYSMFSNEGKIVTPHIGTSEVYEAEEVLFKGNAKKVKNMLIENVKRGTAKKAARAGLCIGGMTGTAHIAKEGKYSNDYHSSFYGFVEDGKKSYTIGILVIEAKAPKMYFASKSAVPVFREVVDLMVSNGLLTPRVKTKKREVLKLHMDDKTISPIKEGKIGKAFGEHLDKTSGVKVFNESIQIKALKNKKVYNVLDGLVVYNGTSAMLGKVLVLSHKDKMHTVYANLSEVDESLTVGEKVKIEQVLGSVENTLTFQVTKDKKYVNPLDLIKL